MNVQNPSASRGIAIQAIDLVKNYGTGSNMVHALRGVNVSFERGKFTAIMGRPAPANPRLCTRSPASTPPLPAISCSAGQT